MITLWKLILSSNGTMDPSLELVRSQVIVFLQTGKRMRAMLNFNVSAPPLATETQEPKTSNTALRLYWRNFQVNRAMQMDIHNVSTHILFQFSKKKYDISLANLFTRFFSFVGMSFWLNILLRARLLSDDGLMFDWLGTWRSNVSKLYNCKTPYQLK